MYMLHISVTAGETSQKKVSILSTLRNSKKINHGGQRVLEARKNVAYKGLSL